MEKTLELQHENNYRRNLFVRGDGKLDGIVSTLYNDWMLRNEHTETLLREVTGKQEFATLEFEQAAEFILITTI